MPVIKLYNFGEKGVNVDSSDLHMQDGEVRRSQNMINNTLGFGGGITNRPGLERFNATAAAGAILGGVGVPFSDGLLAPIEIEPSQRYILLGFYYEA